MERVQRVVPDGNVYELDRFKSYLIVINRKTWLDRKDNGGAGLHSALQGAGIKAVIMITDDAPETAVAVFEETEGCTR